MLGFDGIETKATIRDSTRRTSNWTRHMLIAVTAALVLAAALFFTRLSSAEVRSQATLVTTVLQATLA
jgi:hypothetical protein